MTKVTWFTLVHLLLVSSPMVKEPNAVRVFMPNQSRNAPNVFIAMSAQLKASERFEIVDDYQEADVFVDLRCLKPTGSTDDYACSMTVNYVLPRFKLTRLLTEAITSGKNEEIAASLYRNFERHTTQPRLSAAGNEVQKFVRDYCSDPSHSDECRAGRP